MRTLLLLLVLVGCAAEVPDAGPEVWSEAVDHDDDSWLFGAERINRIDLEIDEEALRILRATRRYSERWWVPAEVHLDFEDAGTVGLRMRGRDGSFEPIDGKPKLKLDFNRYQDGFRFHGLEALALNNAKHDCSVLREHLAPQLFEAVGLGASRTGFAQVFLNGLDYGLYVVVEVHDDRFIKRVYGANEGVLYNGSYVDRGWVGSYLDFGIERDDWFELQEGEDPDFGLIRAVSEALLESQELGAVTPRLEGLVDWPYLLRHWAVDEWMGNWDSYVRFNNNFHPYFPPGEPMQMLPWDFDGAFDAEYREHEDWEGLRSKLGRLCLDNAVCAERWAEAAHEVADRLEEVDWAAVHDRAFALTAEGVEGDPRRPCEPDERETSRDVLARWFDGASDRLREGWPLP